MASDSAVREFPDLKFVDHYERKIISSEKERISPTKQVLNPFRDVGEDTDKAGQKSDDQIEIGKQTIETESIGSGSDDDDNEAKEGKTEESDLDSGLDSSDNVSGENEKFVDRHEDVLDAERPDTLKSPAKTLEPSQSTSRIVDELFNFINDENIDGLDDKDQKEFSDVSNNNSAGGVDFSLDAVNNNQEEIIQVKADELQSKPNVEVDFILTTKTEPAPKIVEENVSLVPDTPGDANMNLYWYSTNLELDPGEIQDFKNAQEGGAGQEIQTSAQDEYYREKLNDYKPPAEFIPPSDDKTRNLDAKSADTQRWSPIFESASSKFLDVASELKSHPDDEKSNGNNVTETKTLEHPWGLEAENKLTLNSESRHEELPLIEPKFHPIADMSHNNQHDDKADGSMKVMFQVRKNVDLKQFDLNLASGKPRETSELKIDLKHEETEVAVDEADATGYMEMKDKDLIKAQQANVIQAAPSEDLENVEGKKKESTENETKEKSQAESPKDQPDATGYMEMADRDKIQAQYQSTVHAQLSVKDVKNVNNMRKKSGDKVVSEQVEKENVEILQSEMKDSLEFQMPEQVTDDTIDIKEFEANIITNVGTLVTEAKDSLGEDTTDAVNQEIKIEFSQKVESEIQKSDSVVLQVEKVKSTVIIKHEPVEIKRKFKVGEDSEQIIINKGGQLIRTDSLIDQYFDDSSYTLTLNDNWLRKRNDAFEMKNSCSVTNGDQVIVDEKMILQSLQKVFHQKDPKATTKTLSELMNDLDLSEFATFQTTRKYYEIEECMLALDLTDFGFQSGDVMVTVDSPAKVPDAIQRMDKLAKDLGKLWIFKMLTLFL